MYYRVPGLGCSIGALGPLHEVGEWGTGGLELGAVGFKGRWSWEFDPLRLFRAVGISV